MDVKVSPRLKTKMKNITINKLREIGVILFDYREPEREREMETGRNSDGSTVKVIYEKACDDERGPSSIRPKLRPNILELVRFASMPAIIARTYNTHTCIPGVDQNSSSSSKRINSSSKYSPLLFTLFTHYVYFLLFFLYKIAKKQRGG